MAEDDKYVIKVEADTGDAKKNLEAVANATKKVGQTSKETAKDTRNLSGVVGQAAEAACSMGGAFGGAGRAIAIFSAPLRALKLALAGATGGISLLIGAIATAVAAIINLFRRHKEELKAFEENQKQLTQTTQENLRRLNQTRLDGLAKAYDEANVKANALLSTADRVAAAHRQWVDANLQWNLSELDRKEQEELAGTIGDTRRQEDIRANYAGQRTRVTAEAALQNAQNDRASADTRLTHAREVQGAKATQLETTMAALQAATDKRERLVKRMETNDNMIQCFGRTERRHAEKGRLEGAYKTTLEEIKALEAAIPRLKRELEDLSTGMHVAERQVDIADLNLDAQRNKVETGRRATTNATEERRLSRQRADAEARARQEERAAMEQQKAEAHRRRIEEADTLAAREAEDVAGLRQTADGMRAGLSEAQAGVQRVRAAYAAAVQRQGENVARMGSLYGRSRASRADAGAVMRTAEEMRRAEEAFRQAASAAETFFKTFDAALKREQGEADRAAQRAKAARETN